MRHIMYLARLLNAPQMITPSAAAAVLQALAPGIQIDGWSGVPAAEARDPRAYQVINGTAIVPLVGELVHRSGTMDASSGLTSYSALRDVISDALTDSAINGILLDCDSPGGEASGVLDFSEWLASQRGRKPIIAHANQMAASAAYALASAADRILLGPSGMVGSVGVVAAHTDLSEALNRQGVKVNYIFAGKHKTDAAPTQPLSDPARERMQYLVDQMYDRFCHVVAKNRGISPQQVVDTNADLFLGQDAIKAGLADAVMDQEAAMSLIENRRAIAGVSMIQSPIPPGTMLGKITVQGKYTMAEPEAPSPGQPQNEPQPASPAPTPPAQPLTDEERQKLPMREELGDLPVEEADNVRRRNTPASPVPASPKAIAQACYSAGFPELTYSLLEENASLQRLRQRLEEAKEIKEACLRARMPKLAETLIGEGLSLEAARKVIFATLAEKDEATKTDSAFHRLQIGESDEVQRPPLGSGVSAAAAKRFSAAFSNRKQ